MIGVEPRTELLRPSIALDSHGFVLTGGQVGGQDAPYATSVSGVFAVGDVRAGSVKRFASALGEGSIVVATPPLLPFDNRFRRLLGAETLHIPIAPKGREFSTTLCSTRRSRITRAPEET